MAKKRMNIDDVLGDTEAPNTSFAEADRKEAGENETKKGGRPIKGRSKATVKLAFHIDEELKEVLEGMIDFPKEKSANAVAKRILEAYCEPLFKKQ